LATMRPQHDVRRGRSRLRARLGAGLRAMPPRASSPHSQSGSEGCHVPQCPKSMRGRSKVGPPPPSRRCFKSLAHFRRGRRARAAAAAGAPPWHSCGGMADDESPESVRRQTLAPLARAVRSTVRSHARRLARARHRRGWTSRARRTPWRCPLLRTTRGRACGWRCSAWRTAPRGALTSAQPVRACCCAPDAPRACAAADTRAEPLTRPLHAPCARALRALQTWRR
jgi:hypothetical protein